MRFLKKNFSIILIASIFLLYVAVLFILRQYGFDINIVDNLTITIGWLLAFILAVMNLQKTREDNIKALKDETRKKMEIDAFREINKMTTEFSSKITSFTSFVRFLPAKLELYIKNPGVFNFDKNSINLEAIKFKPELHEGLSKYILTIEANEIVVIEYDHLRKYIQIEFDEAMKTFDDFDKFLLSLDQNNLITREGRTEFENNCDKVFLKFEEINSFLFDYRIELMNCLLGELFKTEVPRRMPLDPQYKILTEVATPEKVKELEDKRIKDFQIKT